MLSDEDLERYARQAIMPAIGEEGQEKLLAARVLVVGAGGLGAPVIMYLAAAGIGNITIIDHDDVSRTDLNRQVIYNDSDVGRSKSRRAAIAASAINPAIHVSQLNLRLSSGNAAQLFTPNDVIIDCTDNADTRYLLGDTAHACGKPLVFGGAVRMEGQVSVFQSSVKGHIGSPCYRCVFPAMPNAKQAPGCSEAGILGPVAGLVGTLQALETIKIILGKPRTLTGRLLLIEAAGSDFMEIQTTARDDCGCCGAASPATAAESFEVG
ncbi:MAG: HesA/MoeB/ThiF family protein, partial [Alphaproteobacteria bacterium]|jgi:molybdopterin/thiamine biosynthesis adenylyltransferase|nr:HesA/MoeB/ThiF family protein [Alphaproteobacteria bacterium]NDG36766.1 HesA/MoeB/ThiF family protein [Alphaproteobacteria bacterium]